jgi:KaiC/GvpD/RAD55 family RecA-like ATPase
MPDRTWDSDPELGAEADAHRAHNRQANGGAEEWREFELIRFSDMRPRLNGRPLVKGWLEQEQISVIYGEAGCGKTFLALDCALHIAARLDWFGHTVGGGAVVYCAAEAGRGIVNRVAAWGMEHGFDNKDIPFAAVTNSIDLCHSAVGDVDKLVATIRAAGLEPLALLIVDTASRALAGGNENAPDDMGALVRSVDRLRDELHCHVVLVHHTGKDQSRGARGHSLLRAAVDTEIEVTRWPDLSSATITKQRDGISGERVSFRLRQVELGHDEDGDPVTSCVVEPSDETAKGRSPKARLSPAQARALELLGEAIARAGEVPAGCGDHIPAGRHCVGESLWREYCYAGQISDSDKPDARRRAFARAAKALVAASHVGKWQTWVWITRP